MIYGALTLGELREAVDAFIAQMGADTPVGCRTTNKYFIEDSLTLEWVCVDEGGKIVGTEGDDYELRLQPGEVNAIAIS